MERERKSKLQVERQMEERQKKVDEQRKKEEQKRLAVEEKRKQKQEEEKVAAEKADSWQLVELIWCFSLCGLALDYTTFAITSDVACFKVKGRVILFICSMAWCSSKQTHYKQMNVPGWGNYSLVVLFQLPLLCCRSTTKQWCGGHWSVVSVWSRGRKDGRGEECPQTQMDGQVETFSSHNVYQAVKFIVWSYSIIFLDEVYPYMNVSWLTVFFSP